MVEPVRTVRRNDTGQRHFRRDALLKEVQRLLRLVSNVARELWDRRCTVCLCCQRLAFSGTIDAHHGM
jgi:hypothetical protein